VRVNEIRVRGRSAGRAREAPEHQRQREDEVRTAAKVSRDPRPVRDPVMPKARGRDDDDLDSSLADVLDLIRDEETSDVARRPRV
jgi:hypothetical protein